MLNKQEVEVEIQEKGLNAPRLTPELIDSTIVEEGYHHFEDTTVVVCCLRLKNGYTVVGDSACVSDKNFDLELGMKIARDNARNKIWQLEGYLLKDRMFKDVMES